VAEGPQFKQDVFFGNSTIAFRREKLPFSSHYCSSFNLARLPKRIFFLEEICAKQVQIGFAKSQKDPPPHQVQ